jgi:hypothetical protein
MLGKLMKYEFKATARIFLPLFAAMLAVAAISKLTLGLRMQAPHIISLVLSIMLMVGAFVITLILTVQRFYKNFMTDEGSLMFTLPVGTGRLIWSKLIVAAVWTVVCTAAVFLAIMMMTFSGDEWRQLVLAIRELDLPSVDTTFFIIEFCALVLASLLTGILTIYASLALSMFANNHRVALSFGIYIALNTLMQILVSVLMWIFFSPDSMANQTFEAFVGSHALGSIHACLSVAVVITLAFGAGMFYTTRYMLKNQLNLQ